MHIHSQNFRAKVGLYHLDGSETIQAIRTPDFSNMNFNRHFYEMIPWVFWKPILFFKKQGKNIWEGWVIIQFSQKIYHTKEQRNSVDMWIKIQWRLFLRRNTWFILQGYKWLNTNMTFGYKEPLFWSDTNIVLFLPIKAYSIV